MAPLHRWWLLMAPMANTYLQLGAFGQNYVKISAFGAWGTLILSILLVVLMISSIPVSLVSLGMRMAGRSIRLLRLRVFPLLAILSLAAMMILLTMAQTIGDVLQNLGKPTGWSIGIMISSLLFGLFSLVSFFYCGQSFRVEVNKWARIYYLLVGLACIVVASYLTYWGVMGLRTWV